MKYIAVLSLIISSFASSLSFSCEDSMPFASHLNESIEFEKQSLSRKIASNQVCEKSISKEDIINIVEDIIETEFSDLKNYKLSYKFFNSDAYYLATWIKFFSVFKKAKKRKYVIKINEKLLDCPPPPQALRAILVHELVHIHDYTQMRTGKLIGLLKRVGLNKKKRAEYERATDLKAMQMGHAEGIKGYRLWIYPKLTEKDLAVKRRFYWTPEEIDQWMQENPDLLKY